MNISIHLFYKAYYILSSIQSANFKELKEDKQYDGHISNSHTFNNVF